MINDRLEGSGEVEESGEEVPDELRYRIRWQHRHELPHKMRIDLELSRISDRGFLREYFEDELREDKEQETIAYFRKQQDNHPASMLLKAEYEELRDAQRARALARRACDLEEKNDGENLWNYLDTLALAQHRTGDSETAIETQKRAISLIPEDADASVRTRLEEQLRTYQAAAD